MRNLLATLLTLALLPNALLAQTATPRPQSEPEDIVRVTSSLVQTDVVVTDKDDRVVNDLKLSDFEVYESGRRQELKFMEFVGVDEGRRVEGEGALARATVPLEAEVGGGLTARQLKRVVAFVVDDLTIPFEDMPTVRQILRDFVDNEMREGDLVAIVRVIGGKGMLQQFTGDRNLLRRAVAALNVSTHPFAAFNNLAPERLSRTPMPTGDLGASEGSNNPDVSFEDFGLQNFSDAQDETQRLVRGLISLSTANFLIDGMREIPGRKSLVLISGGIPIFEVSSTGTAYSNITYLLNQMTNNAIRAGVVVNTMDPRGLRATSAVKGFSETPGGSGLRSEDPTFGRGGSTAGRADTFSTDPLRPAGADDPFTSLLAGGAEHLGLDTVASATGGVSAVNTNNFKSALDKVLARSRGYYRLAYTPTERFDNKFRKIEVKVRRTGLKVYAHRGYFARDERETNAPRTKEQAILAAAKSPVARRDVDVSANVVLRPAPSGNKTTVEAHMMIDANRLSFRQEAGKHETSFDVVGFVYDQMGRLRGGFSETVNTSLTPENYQRALRTGLTYSASTELPPGYYQFRAVVREASTGSVGTLSKYMEIPDLSKGRLAISSLFLFAVDPAQKQAPPEPLLALRQVSRKRDLRYAVTIFNAKTSGGQTQVRSQMIISQNGKVLFQEPEQPVPHTNAPLMKVGQLGLSKVTPGRYVITLVVTDTLADKKSQSVARSIDFTIVD